jgi:AcrR family transcriptional regulator
MGRPVDSDGRQTRLAILDAALALFAEKGYFGTSLRDIATVVGIRESAIYNYFKSKDALFTALLVADHADKAEQLRSLMQEPIGDARELLEKLAGLALEIFCAPQQQRLFHLVMSDGLRLAKEGRIDFVERMTSGTARLNHLMRRLIDNGSLRPADPELLTLEFMGPLVLWRHRHAIHPHGPLTRNRKALAREHVDRFLRGSAAPAARKTPLRQKSIHPFSSRARRQRARLLT